MKVKTYHKSPIDGGAILVCSECKKEKCNHGHKPRGGHAEKEEIPRPS